MPTSVSVELGGPGRRAWPSWRRPRRGSAGAPSPVSTSGLAAGFKLDVAGPAKAPPLDARRHRREEGRRNPERRRIDSSSTRTSRRRWSFRWRWRPSHRQEAQMDGHPTPVARAQPDRGQPHGDAHAGPAAKLGLDGDRHHPRSSQAAEVAGADSTPTPEQAPSSTEPGAVSVHPSPRWRKSRRSPATALSPTSWWPLETCPSRPVWAPRAIAFVGSPPPPPRSPAPRAPRSS